MATGKRRSPGEGGAYDYKLANGTTWWRIKAVVTGPDGVRKEVNKRGFKSKTEALKYIKQAQVDSVR